MVGKLGEQVVWRQVPRRLSRVIVLYLAAVVPFSQALDIEIGHTFGSKGTNPYLFAKGPIVGGGERISEDALTDSIKDISTRAIGQSIHIKAWRHICVAFGLRYITEFTMIGDNEEGDEDEAAAAGQTMHVMAGYTVQTAIRAYARERNKNDNFDLFIGYATMWHRYWKLGGGVGGPAGAEGGPGEGSAGGDIMNRVQQEARQIRLLTQPFAPRTSAPTSPNKPRSHIYLVCCGGTCKKGGRLELEVGERGG